MPEKRRTHGAWSDEDFLKLMRDTALADAPALLHGLTCPPCGLRQSALSALALCRWTEDEFVEAYFAMVVAEVEW